MNTFMHRAFRSAKDDMLVGFFQSIGADPVSRTSSSGVVSSLFGQQILSEPGRAPKFIGYKSAGLAGNAMGAFVAGSTAYDVYQGYEEKGVSGAARALGMNVALNAALIKHGYTISKVAGVETYNAGKFRSAAQLAKMGLVGKIAGNAGNIGDFMLRAAWGSVLGEAASGLLGGGVLSTPLAMGGATVGARIGLMGTGIGLGAGAVLGAGYLAAKGTGAVLKAGYRHTQTKKLINTDGDMSAFMTQGAFTMRSRAVQAISKSHLNTRSALGQEGSLLSFPSRNYHSPYRRY